MRRIMRQSTIVMVTACCGMFFLMWFNVWFLEKQQEERPWMNNRDEHLTSHRHENMQPLDDYLRYYELPTMKECERNSSLVTNTSLSYLLDLPTPCSSGKEHCVIAFALWCGGVKHAFSHANTQCQRYISHLHNLYGWKGVFRGWELRLYTDTSVPAALLEPYRNVVNIITVNASMKGAGTWGTMWRLLPLWDDSVDRFLTRDIDSVPLVRDWATAYEWIRLGNPSYRWGDHSHHYSHPILAGALGVTRDAFTNKQRTMLLQKYQKMSRFMTKYNDQEFYEANLWPLLKNNILSFDVSKCGEYPNQHPFPVPHSRCDWIMGGPDHLFGERDLVADACRHEKHPSWKWG